MLLLLAALAAADETCTVKVVEPACVALPALGDPVPEGADPLSLLAVPGASWADTSGAATSPAAPSAAPLPAEAEAAARAGVNATLEKAGPALSACLPRRGAAAVDVALRLELKPEGGPARVTLLSSFGDGTVDACVVDALATMRFGATGTAAPVAIARTITLETAPPVGGPPSGLTGSR